MRQPLLVVAFFGITLCEAAVIERQAATLRSEGTSQLSPRLLSASAGSGLPSAQVTPNGIGASTGPGGYGASIGLDGVTLSTPGGGSQHITWADIAANHGQLPSLPGANQGGSQPTVSPPPASNADSTSSTPLGTGKLVGDVISTITQDIGIRDMEKRVLPKLPSLPSLPGLGALAGGGSSTGADAGASASPDTSTTTPSSAASAAPAAGGAASSLLTGLEDQLKQKLVAALKAKLQSELAGLNPLKALTGGSSAPASSTSGTSSAGIARSEERSQEEDPAKRLMLPDISALEGSMGGLIPKIPGIPSLGSEVPGLSSIGSGLIPKLPGIGIPGIPKLPGIIRKETDQIDRDEKIFRRAKHRGKKRMVREGRESGNDNEQQ